MRRDMLSSGGLDIRITRLQPRARAFLVHKMTPSKKTMQYYNMFVTILRLTAPNSITALAAPETPLGELTVLHRPISCI